MSAALAAAAPAVPGLGLADAVHDAQALFRAVLRAMSHPARTVALDPTRWAAPEVPPGAGREAALVLLALADADTTLWLSPRLRTCGVGAWLRFHTGVVLSDEVAAAQWLWLAAGDALPPLAELPLGSDAHPETAATVLAECSGWTVADVDAQADAEAEAHVNAHPTPGEPTSATPAPRRGWRCSGPGLRVPRVLQPAGAELNGLLTLHREAAAHFPRGLDVLLCAPGAILGLPRSTQLQPLGSLPSSHPRAEG